ncbi:hypothetical protein IWT5_01988 [Secundilactobacillus silagincola]|uniref:DUF3899 domain-containing protein n=1 Tax=Secundilactobacillus silagincola TaxID=1714681 RepID=A0A1Z5J419_9LACO|nr:DUF3899 domain-containing protein [Secundilactobacillus silagincola]GAX08823.1 hypothetical protein IWT5_01988 [Secundilactobacillus silagincola]
MKKVKQYRWALLTLVIIVAVGLLVLLWQPLIVVANVWFMIGLVFLIGAAFFVLEKGHLFAGWRRRRHKGEESLPEEKISVREVASLKNAPIVVNKYAWFCLINAIGLIVLSIILTI